MLNKLNILYPIGIYPEKTGGYVRTFNIAKLVSEQFSETTIFAVDEETEYEGRIDNLNIVQKKKFLNPLDKFMYYAGGALSSNFSFKTPPSAFKDTKDTLFQLECPFFYNELKRRSVKNYILNEHNVYWNTLYFSKSKALQKIGMSLLFKKVRSIEINALKNAAHTLVCSELDKRILETNVPEVADKITVIPNCVNFDDYANFKTDMIDEDKKEVRVLFLGFLSYFPNRDAFEIICKRIAPGLENVKFTIIGKNPPNIPIPKNVECLGYVDDIRGYMRDSDICIAPLRYGSGTRLKILEYMAMGKPVISTSKGAEGLEYTDGKNIVIEDNISLFSERITELINNPEKSQFIGDNAKKLIKSKYDWKCYQKKLSKLYENVINDTE